MSKSVIVFVGPAGSGKSSLVHAYGVWSEEFLGRSVCRFNLDPAAEYIPYKPDFDIREYVDAREIALKLGLGPNGALVVAVDMISRKIEVLERALESCDREFILVDTPGQMDVFVFRDTAIRILEFLRRRARRVTVLFVIDASVVRRYEGYTLIALLSLALQTRPGLTLFL